MAELVAYCCECAAPMQPAEVDGSRPGERWYRCDEHGFWESEEVGHYQVIPTAFETLLASGAATLPGLDDAPTPGAAPLSGPDREAGVP